MTILDVDGDAVTIEREVDGVLVTHHSDDGPTSTREHTPEQAVELAQALIEAARDTEGNEHMSKKQHPMRRHPCLRLVMAAKETIFQAQDRAPDIADGECRGEVLQLLADARAVKDRPR